MRHAAAILAVAVLIASAGPATSAPDRNGATGRGTAARSAGRPDGAGAPAIAVRSDQFDRSLYERAVAGTEGAPVVPMTGARVVIVPHHWLAGHLIVGALRDLAATGPTARRAYRSTVPGAFGSASGPAGTSPDEGTESALPRWRRVILLAPDHRDVAIAAAVTADRAWSSPLGDVSADAEAVGRLVRGLAARTDVPAVATEHAVAGLVPALARYLPDASVVPVVVRGNAPPEAIHALAGALEGLMTDDSIVIVSADFAHDCHPREAARRDRASLDALRELDVGAILAAGRLGSDAWAALATAQVVANRLGATRFHLRSRTDGSELPGYGGGPVTSYVSGYYATR